MESFPICTQCTANYAQGSGSSLCAMCAGKRPPSSLSLSSLQSLRICNACGRRECAAVCVCTFPLVELCCECSQKHISTHPTSDFLLQSPAVFEIVKSCSDCERHRKRLHGIEQTKRKLKAWVTGALAKSQFELNAIACKLHKAIENRHQQLLEEMKTAEGNLEKLITCIDQMKEDYSLRSGTVLDYVLASEAIDESQLTFVEEFVYYGVSHTGLESALDCFFTFRDQVPVVESDRSNQPVTAATSGDPASRARCASVPVPRGQQQRSQSVVMSGNPLSDAQVEGQWVRCETCGTSRSTSSPLCTCQYRQSVPSSQYQPGGSVQCSLCSSWLTDRSWTKGIPPQLQSFAEASCSLCSLPCFLRYCQLAGVMEGPPVCVRCGLPSTKETGVKLACEHWFHDIACLYSMMREVTVNFTSLRYYHCPACKQQISSTVIKAHFGREKMKKLLSIRQPVTCHVCKSNISAYALPCAHSCCVDCASAGNAACRTCGKTSTCSIC